MTSPITAATFLGTVVTLLRAASDGAGEALYGWTILDYIPADSPEASLEITKHIMLDIADEGEGVLGDGSGNGVVLVGLIAHACPPGQYSTARTAVAAAVNGIHATLRATAGYVDAARFAYRPLSVLYNQPVFTAGFELERKLV